MTKSYLDKSIDQLERIGLIAAFEMWKKLDPESTSRASVLTDIAFNHLKSENWNIAKSLSYFLMKDKIQTDADILIGKMNYWQCHKWLGEFEKIKDEIYKEDFSARSRIYQLCAYALKDEYEEFFELLKASFPSDISLHELNTWPIFKEIRNTEDYKEFIANNDKKSNQNDGDESALNDFFTSFEVTN